MWCGDARWCARLLSLATARAQAPVPWRTNAELELRNAELVARYEILEAERAALQVTAVTVAGSGPRVARPAHACARCSCHTELRLPRAPHRR